MVVAALALGGIGWFHTRQSAAPAQAEMATVVRFAELNAGAPLPLHVIVRMKDGSERQLRVGTSSTLVHCRKGSAIRLIRQGGALFVDPRGCGQVRSNQVVAPIRP